jgi:hypothetical protein
MLRSLFFAGLWLGFIGYAFLLAPPDDPQTLPLIQNLAQGNVQGINPLIVALFNLMGIWPMVYGAVLFADGRGQKLPAWPFAMGTFALGAFVLIPYLALRQPNPTFTGSKNLALRFWDSRLVAQGNWSDFVTQWQSSRFIHVMSLDFCVLTLLFPSLLHDDLGRRGISPQPLIWATVALPLVGACLYLLLRPSLPDPKPDTQPETQSERLGTTQ